jgi:small multidrug resistance pump
MIWLQLTLAIAFEVAGTICLKLSDGMTKLFFSILVVIFYLLSFFSLSLVLKRIDVGVAYAIWSGAAVTLLAIIGFIWMNESVNTTKILSIVLIILGIIGLNLSEKLL